MGVQQTMTFYATAYSSSTYGYATAYGAGTVLNPYYNAGNTPLFDGTTYDPNGSPDSLSSHGNAGWSDTLTFSGLSAGDAVSFTFNLQGSGSGPIAAGLNFSTDSGGGTYDGFSTTSPNETWITAYHPLNAGGEIGINVDYYAGLTSYTSLMPEGVDYSGWLLSHLALNGISVEDANGNLVSGWSVSAASGASYPFATPEPSGFLAVGAGMVWVFGRRRGGAR
jgi:hypothetical protein